MAKKPVTICDHCRKIVLTSKARFEAPLTLCESCHRQYFDHCIACGVFAERFLLHYPNGPHGDGYCDECYRDYPKPI